MARVECWQPTLLKNPAQMKLQDLLKKENNNLDIFRLIAACMVIWGHAYAISPEAGSVDYIGQSLGFDYSGSLAVKIFFFLSGLVVTNSLIAKGSALQFATARFFRIWPALLATLLISAIIVGPVTSNLALSNYFSDSTTYQYVWNNLLLHTHYKLPGVFSGNSYKDVINGSLWTIPYEVAAYLILLALFLLGAFQSKILPMLVFALILLDPLFGNRFLFTWLPQNHEIDLLAPCFAFGSLLAIYKDKIEVNARMLAGAWILAYLFKNQTFNFYFFYLALFIFILYVSHLKWVVDAKFKTDISYGIYLWGFPVQQTLAHIFPGQSVIFNQLSAIGMSILLGFLSWHLIEKKCITLGAHTGRYISRRINPQGAPHLVEQAQRI